MEDHILIKPSQRFIEVLLELCQTFGSPASLKSKLPEGLDKSDIEVTLTTQEIKWCHEKMRERGIKERVHELLAESEVILPTYTPPPRNPELEARVQKLRFEQENREYKAMTKSVDANAIRNGAGLDEIGKDLHAVNRQLVSGAQYLLSVVGTFFAVFLGLGMAMDDYGVRALVATIAALVVGLAEMYFIIREDLREEERIEKNK